MVRSRDIEKYGRNRTPEKLSQKKAPNYNLSLLPNPGGVFPWCNLSLRFANVASNDHGYYILEVPISGWGSGLLRVCCPHRFLLMCSTWVSGGMATMTMTGFENSGFGKIPQSPNPVYTELMINTLPAVLRGHQYNRFIPLLTGEMPIQYFIEYKHLLCNRHCSGLLVLLSGLAVPLVGVNAFATARNLVDKMVTVRYVSTTPLKRWKVYATW